jgi:hypothetical protein
MVLLSAAAGTLGACGVIQPARMAVPAGLDAAADHVTITGLGASPRGEYRVAEHGGTFARSATRLSFFDMVATDRAKVTFSINGPTFAAPVNGRCGLAQRTANISIVTFTPRPLQYECRFEGLPGATLVLQEASDGLAGKLGQAQRRGYIDVAGTRLALRSVHHVQGSPLPLDAPIGYAFEADGRVVGAIDLNGTTPDVLLPKGGSARQAALLAALALALVWDPANRIGG